jgi:hypothetical protein
MLMIRSLYLIKKEDVTDIVDDLNNIAGKLRFTHYKIIFLGLSPI